VLRATVTERIQPGVVYTTFHFPESGANVITTDNSDWATNCPEYKVTAVQVMPVRAAIGDVGMLVREDVGRHNALDKLVGALWRERLPADEGFVVITSRASYEMVGKTARAGVALLAAVSGVTGLAIDTAQQAGVALAGYARGADLTLYAHEERMLWNEPNGQ
jgi:formate dehydrogenase accessory protein FdhD